MQTIKKLLGIAAILAVIGFLALPLTGCDNDTTSGGGGDGGGNDKTPVDSDFIIGNLLQLTNSISAVTVTAQDGKSTGSVTVYYDGTGDTTYVKNTTLPTAAGTYAVTFDVAAATGWKAVAGLSAGTLAIKDQLTSANGLTIADEFATWLSSQPANTPDTAYTVPLNVSNLGHSNASGFAGYVLKQNSAKYVSLDLSGSPLTIIDQSAFTDCTTLTGVIIPDGIQSIANYAFNGCFNLASVTIPDGVTSIGNYAFSQCKFDSVTLPSDLIIIGSGAFQGCSNLTSVAIPADVTSIGDYAFSGTSKLASITADTSNTAYSSQDDVLYNKDQTKLVQYPQAKAGTTFSIPATVNSIGDYAFYRASLTSVTIPEGVTVIGSGAFSDCTNLTDAAIPSTVTSIKDRVFMRSKLSSAVIPAVVQSIGDYAFHGCDALTSVMFARADTSLGITVFIDEDNTTSLQTAYTEGGIGTYTRTNTTSTTWTKQ